MFVFAVIYGLDWFATVPPVVAIAGNTFGKNSVGSIYGLIFLAHQLGGAAMAQGSGIAYDVFGDYVPSFLTGAVLAVLAAGMSMAIAKDNARPTAGAASARTGGHVGNTDGVLRLRSADAELRSGRMVMGTFPFEW